jgi:hypothetical protein
MRLMVVAVLMVVCAGCAPVSPEQLEASATRAAIDGHASAAEADRIRTQNAAATRQARVWRMTAEAPPPTAIPTATPWPTVTPVPAPTEPPAPTATERPPATVVIVVTVVGSVATAAATPAPAVATEASPGISVLGLVAIAVGLLLLLAGVGLVGRWVWRKL